MARAKGEDKTPLVSVVTVTYRSGPTLPACLAALAAQTFGDFEVILSDNDPEGGAARAAADANPALRLLDNGDNLGFAAGNNRAAAIARGKWLVLINPDAYAAPDWLARLVAAAGRHPQYRCFTSRQLMAGNDGLLDGLGDVMSGSGFPFRGGYRRPDPGPIQPGESFSACGGAMMIERELFIAMGGFDERLFCYCEDVDLGYRLRLVGEGTLVVPDAVVRHEGAASTGGARSEFAAFHGARNRLWVFVKDTPPLLLWLTAPLHLLATAVLFARHATRGELAAPWRGLMAGLAGLGVALAARREAQKARTASSADIARAMTFDPLDLLLRRVVIRPPRPRPGGP